MSNPEALPQSSDGTTSASNQEQADASEQEPLASIPEETNSENVAQLPATNDGTYLGLIKPYVGQQDADFVCVTDYIPTIEVELKYATEDNISGTVIYDFTSVYLRCGTVKKLEKVQQELLAQGLRLKIWDGFRPVAAQFALWAAYPNATYVANPNNGYSSHSRGNAVDVTLVNLDGTELEMPTGFDDFSSKSDRDYSDCSEDARKNALLLENVMKEYGFKPYEAEWWHFTDVDSYPVEKSFTPTDIEQ